MRFTHSTIVGNQTRACVVASHFNHQATQLPRVWWNKKGHLQTYRWEESHPSHREVLRFYSLDYQLLLLVGGSIKPTQVPRPFSLQLLLPNNIIIDFSQWLFQILNVNYSTFSRLWKWTTLFTLIIFDMVKLHSYTKI